MGKGQELVEAWGERWEGWGGTALGQVPVEIAFAIVVEQGFLTRQVFPAPT